MVELSVIIPAYNEEARLAQTLASIYQFLANRGSSFEILVVDDGSKDRTIDVVEDFARHHDQVRMVSYAPNQGKGFAVKTGILAGSGDFLLIDDADGSSPIEELQLLEKEIDKGADIAIGSRAKPDATRKVDALIYRKLIGNTFNTIVQILLLPGFYDTQCGFKLFKHQCARDIFSASKQKGFAFDVEILHIAKRRGYKINEVAINWSNIAGSKVNVVTDSAKMLFEVLRIWLTAMSGGYNYVSQEETPLALRTRTDKIPPGDISKN